MTHDVVKRELAPLPDTYTAARQALAECSRVDECKDWADKAAALASYARQADDDGLYQMARRIQGRAVRRAGELLKTFQSKGGRPSKTKVGARPSLPASQRHAADAAGMSEHQEKQAVRVANVPEDEFERAVEADNPPTVTALAGMGGQPAPAGFAKATHLIGSVRRFADFCAESGPEDVAEGVMESERSEVAAMVIAIDGWLDRFIVHIGTKE